MGRGRGWLIAGAALAGAMAGGLAARAVLRRQERLIAQRARNREVRVFVLGAGVVGSTYAAHLAHWGMEVTLLARGRRLQELAERGLQVEDGLTRRRLCPAVRLVAEVPAEGEYDLALVAVRYTQTPQALQALQPLAATTPILLLQHNPAGAGSLGAEPPLLGFPGTGGVLVDGVVRSWPLRWGTTILGEADGAATQRLHLVASILRWAGLKVEVQRQIGPWLQTHAAMIATLAACVYKNGGNVRRMAWRSEEARLYLQALREAYTILAANGIPITPPTEAQIFSRPPWLQLALVRSLALAPWASTLLEGYLAASVEEMKALYDHLLGLARQASVEVPTLSALSQVMT